MPARLILLRCAVGLLYLGPILAGLSGVVAAQLPVFILLFLGWLVVLRPRLWPWRPSAWRAALPWLALSGRALVQGVLVLVCVVIGSGIGLLSGPLALPVWLPLLVSSSAILLGRMVVDPARDVETDAVLEDALRRVNALAQDDDDDPTERLAPLMALDDDASDAQTDSLLDAQLDGDLAAPGFADLARHLRDTGSGRNALRKGVIRLATDPGLADMGKGSAAVTEALFVAGTSPDLLTLFLDRAEALYAKRPDLWGDYPSPDTLRELAKAVADPDITGRLRRMADRMEEDDS